MTREEIIKAIKELSVLELAELVKDLEKEFGITAAPMVPAAAVAAASAPSQEAAPAAAPVEEKTEFTVLLQDVGPNKINVIKAVREVTTLGLREAKELVESAPKPVKEGIGKQEAQQIKEKLEAAGATVQIQ
jgi:large subunit ribosomal protein L7/L12